MGRLRSKCAKIGFVMIFLLGHIQLTELAPAFSVLNFTREDIGVRSTASSQTEADKAIAKIPADKVENASPASKAEESNKSDGNGTGEQTRDAATEEPAYAYDVLGKKVINQYGDNGGSPRLTAEFLGTSPSLLSAPSYSSGDHIVKPTMAGGESTKSNPMKKTSMTPGKKARNPLKEESSGDVDFRVDIGVESSIRHHPPLSPTMLTTTPNSLHDDTNEKIIKLADVEKIDLKSMKKYQSQINAGGVSYGIAKKKLGGVVMGHDGVKVTKKKQLAEKGFVGDEVLMNNFDNSQKITDPGNKSAGVPQIGHLGPLVFRERTFNEHAAPHSAFSGKVNRSRGDGEERYLGSVMKVDEPEPSKGLSSFLSNRALHTKIEFKTPTTEMSTTSIVYETTKDPQTFNTNVPNEESINIMDFEFLGQLNDEQKDTLSNKDLLNLENEPLGIFQLHAKKMHDGTLTTSVNNENSVINDVFGIESTHGTPTEKTTESLLQESSAVFVDKQSLPLTTLLLELGMIEEEQRGSKENSGESLLQGVNTFVQENNNVTPTSSHISGHDTTITESEMRSTQKSNFEDFPLSETTVIPSTATSDLPASSEAQTILNIASSTKFSPSSEDLMAESVTFFEIFSTPANPQNFLLPTNDEKKFEAKQQSHSDETPDQTSMSRDKASQIEIEINVSEGTGNMSRDLMQFSFRNSADREKFDKKPFNSTSTYKFEALKGAKQDTFPNFEYSNETDILVVEITGGENSTDGYQSNENQEEFSNENLKFAIHGERPQEFESVKFRNFHDYDTVNSKSSASRESNGEDDDLFVPDLKLEPYEDLVPATASSDLNNRFEKEAIDRDSDTIFYISNTEVKVVESVPTPNTSSYRNSEQKSSAENLATHREQHHTSKLESQFFPAIYEEDVIIDFPKKNSTAEGRADRYEEDIILSPLKNNFDPLKIIRNRNELRHSSGTGGGGGSSSSSNEEIASRANSSPEDNLSVSYVAESFIDAHEFPSQPPSVSLNRKDVDIANDSQSSDVIIQPAVIPEMSIGVPVIGELPPQIELKEIDFLPGNSNSNGNSVGGGTKDVNSDDDSIQYGGDLIANSAGDISAGGAFDMGTGYAFGGDRMSGSVGDNDVTVTSQIVMHAVDNFQKNELVAELPGDGVTAFKDTSSKRTGNSSAPDTLSNATAYSVLDDNDGEFNFTDLQTLFLACFATLAPLVLSVLLAFGLRYLWRKYRRDPSSGNGLVGDNSTDPLAAKSMNLSQDELKSTESGYTINRSNDTLESSTEIVAKYDGCGGGVTVNGTATTNMLNHSGANGSVITMTLKNNHLIVETEERNDISRDARETKMHYTPSEKDGVFVVEVARGVDSAGIPDSPHKGCIENRQGGTRSVDIASIEKSKGCDSKPANHEEVQIHQPPDGVSDHDNLMDVGENTSQKSEPCLNFGSSNTGLSQSDLSTSSGDSNKGYKYGNQQLYTLEGDDTRPHSPVAKRASPVSPQEDGKCENGDCPGEFSGEKNANTGAETKPVITAALLKQDTVVEAPEKKVKHEENGSRSQSQETTSEILQLQLGNGEVSLSMDNGPATEAENGFDSIISLPAPPSTEEIKQMSDILLMENSQLDSLPPPPPPENQSQTVMMTDVNTSGISNSTETQQNGVAVVALTGSS